MHAEQKTTKSPLIIKILLQYLYTVCWWLLGHLGCNREDKDILYTSLRSISNTCPAPVQQQQVTPLIDITTGNTSHWDGIIAKILPWLRLLFYQLSLTVNPQSPQFEGDCDSLGSLADKEVEGDETEVDAVEEELEEERRVTRHPSFSTLPGQLGRSPHSARCFRTPSCWGR